MTTTTAVDRRDLDIAKFWSHVDRSEGPLACWPWQGPAQTPGGRGRVRIDGRLTYAYRIAWALTNGRPFPADLQGCHTCDNPACVNPAHIYPGTAKQNSRDSVERGRARIPEPRFGLDHHRAAVAPEVIRAAVEEYLQGGVSQAAMGRRLDVSQSTFGRWVRAEGRPDTGLDGHTVGRGQRGAGGLRPCGTVAAYVRHRSRGEKPCEACRAAENAYQRSRKSGAA